jgi:hypothetical protein
MKNYSLVTIGLTAVAYLVLNHLWLAAANSGSVSDGTRPLLKALCLIAAVGLYLAVAGRVALHTESHWIRSTALIAGAAVAMGLILIVLSSLIWYKGQFFHDAGPVERIPTILAVLVGASLVAAAVAPIAGAVARVVWKPSG